MPDEPEETGGLSVLECAVIGLAVGAALYVGWSAYQPWRADRARSSPIDADSVEVPATSPIAQNGHVVPAPAAEAEVQADAAG